VKLFNEYDSAQVMDMLDALLIEDSLYDEDHDGRVVKKRLMLDKDYQRNRKEPTFDESNIDPAAAFDGGTPDYLELGEDGIAPGLDPRIQPSGM
jgi:hypothetical protein